MIKTLGKTAFFSLALLLPAVLAHAQDIPAVTAPSSYQGFQIADLPGTFNWSLHASENLRTGYYGGSNLTWGSSFGGDASLHTASVTRPLMASYSGGYVYTSGQISRNQIFQNLDLSQQFIAREWQATLGDSVNYLPEAPSGGFSGVPGQGNLGVGPPSTGPAPILSHTGQRVGNTATGDISRNITGRTSIKGSGNYLIERYLDLSGGRDTNSLSGSGNLTHQFDPLKSMGGNYSYSYFSYPNSSFSFVSQSVTIQYTRQWTRRFQTDGSIGPQWTHSDNPQPGATGGTSLNFSATGSASYGFELGSLSAHYTHGVSGGSGVLPGAQVDTLEMTAERPLGHVYHLSSELTYSRHTTLKILTATPSAIQTFVANAQISAQIGRYLSSYLSYNLQKQESALTNTSFNGVSHVVAIGISYTPRQVHFGH